MAVNVLETRHKADRALAGLGLPTGRTFVVMTPGDGTPDVIWECTYRDINERTRVEDVLDSSPKFTAIRREQSSQLANFVREYFTAVSAPNGSQAQELKP